MARAISGFTRYLTLDTVPDHGNRAGFALQLCSATPSSDTQTQDHLLALGPQLGNYVQFLCLSVQGQGPVDVKTGLAQSASPPTLPRPGRSEHSLSLCVRSTGIPCGNAAFLRVAPRLELKDEKIPGGRKKDKKQVTRQPAADLPFSDATAVARLDDGLLRMI